MAKCLGFHTYWESSITNLVNSDCHDSVESMTPPGNGRTLCQHCDMSGHYSSSFLSHCSICAASAMVVQDTTVLVSRQSSFLVS